MTDDFFDCLKEAMHDIKTKFLFKGAFMSKITNTSKEDVHPEWLLGDNPNAIENQEKRGQDELVNSSQLPFNLANFREDALNIYKKLGIEILEYPNSLEDEIFIKVRLPKGWKLQATNHSMRSLLIDNKDRTRAMIFYKAAFYDRHAHISFTTRFKIERIWDEEVFKKYSDCYE